MYSSALDTATFSSLDSENILNDSSVPDGLRSTHPSSKQTFRPSVMSTSLSRVLSLRKSIRPAFLSTAHGTLVFTVKYSGRRSTCSDRGPFLATHSNMTATAMAPSRQY